MSFYEEQHKKVCTMRGGSVYGKIYYDLLHVILWVRIRNRYL